MRGSKEKLTLIEYNKLEEHKNKIIVAQKYTWMVILSVHTMNQLAYFTIITISSEL